MFYREKREKVKVVKRLLVALLYGVFCLGTWVRGAGQSPAIKSFFMLFMFLKGDVEAGILSVIFSALAIWCNLPTVLGIFNGTTSKVDVIGALIKKFRKK